jgi:hypothetical protein
MNQNLEFVVEKQKRRYRLLLELWKATGGKELKRVNFMEVAKRAGFDAEEAGEIEIYFTGEELFGHRDVGGGVSLSHKAIVEIESSLTHPNEATQHFSTTVIQHFNGPVGAVQAGPSSTASVTKNLGANLHEVITLIDQLREQFQSLTGDTKQQALEVADALTEEIQRSNPSIGKIRAFLAQVAVFAQDVTGGTSATLLAEAIANHFS